MPKFVLNSVEILGSVWKILLDDNNLIGWDPNIQ